MSQQLKFDKLIFLQQNCYEVSLTFGKWHILFESHSKYRGDPITATHPGSACSRALTQTHAVTVGGRLLGTKRQRGKENSCAHVCEYTADWCCWEPGGLYDAHSFLVFKHEAATSLQKL